MENSPIKIKIDNNNALKLNLQKEKVLILNDSVQKYTYIYDRIATFKMYKEILSSLPKWKGAVVLYGQSGDQTKLIDCMHSDNSLKESFAKSFKKSSAGEMVDRYSWLENLLLSKQFSEIKFFTSTTF